MKLNGIETDYDNDTGLDDKSYAEWWIVSGVDQEGVTRSFKCITEDDARWLSEALGQQN